MNISWIIFLVLVAIFIYRGYRQGIWAASTRILSLTLAYVVALLSATRLAPIIEAYTVIQGMAALVSAGLALFFITSLSLSVVFSLLGKLFSTDKPSTLSASMGAAMGGLVGTVVGLAAVFLVSYLMEVLPKDKTPAQIGQPTAIERLARHGAATIVTWVAGLSDVDPSTTKISAALVREPGVMVQHLQNLQQNQDVRELFNDENNQAALRHGDVATIQQLPSFQKLARNPDVQQLMSVSGLNEQGNGDRVLAEQMSTVWQRAELIKNDQRLQSILRDPEFRQQLENGNPMALLNNPEFMEIASVLLRSDSKVTVTDNTTVNLMPENSTQTPVQGGGQTPPAEPTIHRWVDDDGNIHYSNRKPDPNSSQ